MDVSIIIISWKVRELLKNCLGSVFDQTVGISFEVLVVDNNSGDGTAEMVRKNFPQVYLLTNQDNVGFAQACNQAIRVSQGDYLLFLNPDTEIIDQAIVKTFAFAKNKKNAGITGCKIINADGSLQPSVRKFPDLFSHIFILLKLHNFIPNFYPIRRYYEFDWPHNETKPVDQVMGAFFMVKRDVFKDVGLFDKNFYIWFEEVDFCLRAKKAGWLTYFFPGATIRHQKGESFKKKSALRKQLIFNKSLLYYFFKNRPVYEYLVLLLLTPLSVLLAAIVQLTGMKKKYREL